MNHPSSARRHEYPADPPPTGAAGRQEFPAAMPAVLQAEATALESLVHHRGAVDASVPLELAYRAFSERKVDYLAVQRDERVIGVASRGQIGFVMGSRFGFALYSQTPIEAVMVAKPLIVDCRAPVRTVLDLALARHGEEFQEDAVLVDDAGRLLGLIRVEALAQLQSRLVAEQLDELRRQQAALRQQHLELFRASHAARQSQSLYLGLFEGHTLGVALLNAQGDIHEHNRRLAELLGFGEAPASVISLAAWLAEADRPAFLALLAAHAQGRPAATREFTFCLPERGARLFRCSTGWIRETGQVCACLDDITDQRALERHAVRQEKQTLLDTLVGGIAHELNNKLTPVQGFAELLSLDPREEVRSHTAYIQRSVAEAAHIIRQLLQFSKPHAAVSRPVDLRAVVEETLGMLRFQIREARCAVHPDLPDRPVWALGDAGQLKQVALNLVLNAIQAATGGADPLVTVAAGAAPGAARLVVTDNGPGIAPENIGRIFEPFFTTKGPERGSGLGLSVCFGIVRQHGGEIAVASEPRKGARFSVSLPAGEPPAICLAPEGATVAGVGRGNAAQAVVLVVDDEEVIRMLLQEMLRARFGCRVEQAGHGADALTAIRRQRFDLVVSDIRMPVMSGPELFLRLREEDPAAARAFVFLTGHPGGPQLEEEIARWDVPVLAKPFTLARLAEVCGPFLMPAGPGSAGA